jgi:hypothetical protein
MQEANAPADAQPVGELDHSRTVVDVIDEIADVVVDWLIKQFVNRIRWTDEGRQGPSTVSFHSGFG